VALGGQPAPRRTGLKGPAKRGAAVVARAQDKLCKDMVNQKKDVSGLEGTVKVTFLGKGGQEFTLDCPLDTYMLDAGIAAGLELPYSCRGGICGACVGKAITGEYDASDISDLEFTMTPTEIKNGMVLTCMTRPVTDCVVETQSDYGYSLGDDYEWPGPTGNIFGGKVQPLMGKKWDDIKAETNK